MKLFLFFIIEYSQHISYYKQSLYKKKLNADIQKLFMIPHCDCE